MGDVFSDDNSAPIVDCDLLEAAKENVQPLATGRRVTALSSILATPHAQRESKLAATRQRLRMNVELALEDQEDDPLEAYCRFVNWTVENYPQGHSAESGLLELLEEATRVLKDDRNGKWRPEMRYLKLWLLYASYVEKPTIIYRFLIANEIGTSHALLYEEFAAVLERDGRRKEADEAYTLGIARKAQPLEHLQSRHSDFQKRIMCATASPNPESTPVPVQATATRSSRTVLAPAASSSSSSSSRTGSSGHTRIPSVSSQRGLSAKPATGRPTSNSSLQVFVDPTGEVSEAMDPSKNTWNDLGTRKTRVKENVPEVKKMAGTTLRQPARSKKDASASSATTAGGAPRSAPASKIVPYRDPGPEAMRLPAHQQPAASSSTATSGTGTLGRKASGTATKSKLKIFVDDDLPPSTPAVPASAPQPPAESVPVPATPRFVPFRDESALTTSSASIPDTVMKDKKTGLKAPVSASESEALRKDPLKNYGDLAGLGISDT